MPFDTAKASQDEAVSDEALLVAFGNGDMSAARILTMRLTPKLLGFAANMLGDRTEAEDITQEAMLKLWKIAPEWRQGEAKHTALQQALGTLPDSQREAVVLRHIEGLSNPEIAEVLDISIEAVESLTARAKRALAQALASQKRELGFEDDEP